MEQFELLIPGAPPATGRISVVAPFDRCEIAQIETGGLDHVELALATAHALYRDHDAWLSLSDRIGILERAADLMREQRDALALEAAREGGKPLPDSQIEADRAIDGMAICIEHLRTEAGQVIPMGGTAGSLGRVAFTATEPIGVVVAVSAFNHPLNLIIHQVAAAVAAGCPVIVKPAGATPLSCFRFVKILHEAGLPESWCQALVADNNDTTTALVCDSRVGFFSFIGSARVGWMLRSKLAPGTRCALEHGGVAPALLAEDADHDLALESILKGGFYHAGQVCVSVQRVYVPRAQARAFAERLAAQADELRIGDPTDLTTEIGPLIRPSELDRIDAWVKEAVDSGAECLSGGRALSETCYACTVLLEPPETAKVSQQEIFGPVVCVYAYDSLDDAVDLANSLPVSFQGAVYTRDLDTALRVFKRLDASAVMVNDHTAFRVDGMPFAGLRESGLGVGGIPHTIRDMQVEKMLVIKSPELA